MRGSPIVFALLTGVNAFGECATLCGCGCGCGAGCLAGGADAQAERRRTVMIDDFMKGTLAFRLPGCRVAGLPRQLGNLATW
jgi:hypothetical protein